MHIMGIVIKCVQEASKHISIANLPSSSIPSKFYGLYGAKEYIFKEYSMHMVQMHH